VQSRWKYVCAILISISAAQRVSGGERVPRLEAVVGGQPAGAVVPMFQPEATKKSDDEVSALFTQAWVRAVVRPGGAFVYPSPPIEKPDLGKYPAGAEVIVHFPAEDGFFKIFFAKPWKGLESAWIPENQVDLNYGPKPGQTSDAPPMDASFADAEPVIDRKDTGYLSVVVGLSTLAYRQTLVAPVYDVLGMVKVDGALRVSPGIELQADFFSSVATILSNQWPSTVQRWMGGHVHLGLTPFPRLPVELTFLVGESVGMLNTTLPAFGYQPIFYFDCYPMLRLQLNQRVSVMSYVKYSPITSFRLSQSEFSAGGAIIAYFARGGGLTYRLDFSSLGFNIPAGYQAAQETWVGSFGFLF
jgi:hypothetical protein